MNKDHLDFAIEICDTDEKLFRYIYEHGMAKGLLIGFFAGFAIGLLLK